MISTARSLCLAAGLVLLAGPEVSAENSAASPGAASPESLIRATIVDAFAVLKDKALAGKEQRPRRIASLRRIADRTFDWAEMARSSLGVAWRSLDETQRRRFVDVFKDLLAAQYMDDIDRFQGTETVTVDGSTREGDDTVVRSTLVTAGRERVPIDYRMRVQGAGAGAGVVGRWVVVDLSIEGVSLVNHFRKTFARALANMTPNQLIDHLRKQLPAGEP
ncbi:MAG TPA: ABC transporter substrate-binding protein [Polyangia bacterium]|nr:ABC transporter substrate-binding protein [Polyangia bacterium]